MKNTLSNLPDALGLFRYVGRKEAAYVLGISERFLDRLRHEPGFPPARRINGSPKWRLVALLVWMEQQPSC